MMRVYQDEDTHHEPSGDSGPGICSVGGGGDSHRARRQKKRQRMQVHRRSGSGEESQMPVMQPAASPGGTRIISGMACPGPYPC